MRVACLASLLLVVGLAPVSRADETLTLDLPPSHLSTAPPTRQSASPTGSPEFARYNASHTPRPPAARTLSSRGRQEGEGQRVVGRLGISARVTAIRSGRSWHRRTLARVQPGTYLALTGDDGAWYGVLMADGSTGWVHKGDVQLLNYEVVGPDRASQPARYAGSAPSLGSQLLSGGQRSILQVAYSFLGVPYKWGGTSARGLDCSAFVRRCFDAVGVSLPRTAHEQYQCGLAVSGADLQAADRLYFASRDGRITHTGIYIGNGYFIHSSSKNGGVSVSRLTESLYQRMYAGARR